MTSHPSVWSRSETRQWTVLLFIASICVYAARVSLPITVTVVAREYNWTKAESGIVLASFFWGYASTQAPGGYLADRYGGDNVLMMNTFGWSVLTLGTPFLFSLAYMTVSPITTLVVVRVLLGVAQGFHFPSTASLVSARLISSEKGRVFGIVTAGSHFGTMVCGSVGSIILERYGWRAVMYFIGLLGISWVAYVRRLSKRRFRRRPRYRLESGDDAVAVDKQKLIQITDSARIHSSTLAPSTVFEDTLKEVHKSESSSSGDYSVPWRKLLSQSAFWAAFIAHYSGANAFFTLFSWLPSYFHETYPEAQGWVFNTLPHAVLAVTSMCAPAIATRLINSGCSVTMVRRLMECTALGGFAFCLFVLTRVTSYHAALLIVSSAMALRGLHHGGVSVNVNDFAPDHTGAVFGLMNMAGAIPGFIGRILQYNHSYPLVFAVTGVQCLIGMVVYGTFSTAKQLI